MLKYKKNSKGFLMKIISNNILPNVKRNQKNKTNVSARGNVSFTGTVDFGKDVILQRLLKAPVMPEKEQRAYVKIIEQCRANMASDSVEVAQKAREVYEKAAKKLVKGNARFIFGFARKYANNGREVGDLFAEGVRGAMRGCQAVTTSENKPISYIAFWINQQIKRSVDQTSGMVRTPDCTLAKLKKYTKLVNQGLTDEEIKAKTGWSDITLAHQKENLKSKVEMASLDEENEDGFSLGEVVADTKISHDAELEQNQIKQKAAKALESLEESEKNLLKAFFGVSRDQQTLVDYSKATGETVNQLRNAKRSALLNMERELKKQGIRKDALRGSDLLLD